jgi:hypothetical protein
MEARLRTRKNEAALFMVNKVAGLPRTHLVEYIRKLFRVSETRVPPQVTF